MKAAVIERYDAPLVVRDVEKPIIGPEEVLVRVRACGVCGTDLKIHSGKFSRISIPIIPGHEISGEVYEVGDQVKKVEVGDRVVVHIYLTCGQCQYCLAARDTLCQSLKGQVGFTVNGGMAEFVKVPATNVLPIGKTVPFSQAAALPDAVATAYHALCSRVKIQKGQVLVVVGAGGVGLHAIQIAKVLGAKVLAVDVKDDSLQKAAELGADVVLNSRRDDIPKAIEREGGKAGAEWVMDVVGQPETLDKDLGWLCAGGKLIVVGYNLTRPFSVFPQMVVSKELEVIGCRGMTRQDLAAVITWLEEGKIVSVVDGVLPLSEVNEAYERIRDGKVLGRLILEP